MLKQAAFIALLSLLPSGARADYDGGQILNKDETFSGEIKVTLDSPNAANSAVQINGEKSGYTTLLEGDIRISSGKNYETSTSPMYGHGVYLNGSTGTGNNIVLKTASASDRIIIDVYDYVGSGVRNDKSDATSAITLDASASSGGGISINLRNTTHPGSSTTEAAGIYASAGKVNVTGVLGITTAQERGYGLWTGSASSDIRITGDTTLATTGKGSYGIRADGGTVSIDGDLTVTTTGAKSPGSFLSYGAYGIHARGQATVTVTGTADITTSGEAAHGLHTGALLSGTPGIIEAGILKVNTDGSGAHGLYVLSGGSIRSDEATVTTTGSNSYGLYSSGTGSNITIKTGKVNINTTGHGVYASGTNSKITLNGIETLTVGSGAHSIHAASKGRVEGVGQYTFTGDIYSSGSGSMVDLTMEDASRFTGQTTVVSSGAIDLALAGVSNWTLTADSSLSNLTIDAGSSLTFTLSGQYDFTKITGSNLLTMETGSLIEVVLDGYSAQAGDSFRLITASSYDVADVSFDFDRALLSAGLYWDTGDFADTGTIRVTAVPEPAACALLAGAVLLGWAVIRRR